MKSTLNSKEYVTFARRFVKDLVDDMFYDYEFCSINEESETFIDINNTGGKY